MQPQLVQAALKSFSNRVIVLGPKRKGLSEVDSRTLHCRTPEKSFGGEFSMSEKLRVWAQKSEFEAKSRSYRLKIRVAAGQAESPRKGTRVRSRCYRNNP